MKSHWDALQEGRKFRPDDNDGPHGWIQWKGTDVCMDIYCPHCGEHTHLDADFAYTVRCGACKGLMIPSPYIEMVPIVDGEIEDFCEAKESFE